VGVCKTIGAKPRSPEEEKDKKCSKNTSYRHCAPSPHVAYQVAKGEGTSNLKPVLRHSGKGKVDSFKVGI